VFIPEHYAQRIDDGDYSFWEELNSRERRQATPPANNLCMPKKLGLPVLGEGRCSNANVNSQQISGDTGCAGISGAPNQVCAVSSCSKRNITVLLSLCSVMESENLHIDINKYYPQQLDLKIKL
jgi:hypothetical protein